MDVECLSDRRFTDHAQLMLRQIVQRALDRGMLCGEFTAATAGMLAILSIVRWERKVARAVLEQLKVDLDSFARDLDAAIEEEGDASRTTERPRIDTSDGRQVLVVDMETPQRPLKDLAEEQAHALDHTWVGSEHLLLAAVVSACPRFHDVLDRHGISMDSLRKQICDIHVHE